MLRPELDVVEGMARRGNEEQQGKIATKAPPLSQLPRRMKVKI
jgi:hypothetical protein